MRPLWAYAYRVAPPPADAELAELRRRLDDENAVAFEHARAWAAQLILEQRSTQILIIADTPAQNQPVNRRLEAALRQLQAHYHLTDPIAIRGPASPVLSPSSSRASPPRTRYSRAMG